MCTFFSHDLHSWDKTLPIILHMQYKQQKHGESAAHFVRVARTIDGVPIHACPRRQKRTYLGLCPDGPRDRLWGNIGIDHLRFRRGPSRRVRPGGYHSVRPANVLGARREKATTPGRFRQLQAIGTPHRMGPRTSVPHRSGSRRGVPPVQHASGDVGGFAAGQRRGISSHRGGISPGRRRSGRGVTWYVFFFHPPRTKHT